MDGLEFELRGPVSATLCLLDGVDSVWSSSTFVPCRQLGQFLLLGNVNESFVCTGPTLGHYLRAS